MSSADEKTPARAAPVSDTAVALADVGIALGTAATRLDNAAELVRGVAVKCAEAARLVDDYGPADRAAFLLELEQQLNALGEAIYDTRRKVRDSRMAVERTRR